MQQHYKGEVGKSITFVLLLISVYSVPNIVEIVQHYSKINRGFFSDSPGRLQRYESFLELRAKRLYSTV